MCLNSEFNKLRFIEINVKKEIKSKVKKTKKPSS